VDKSVKSAFPMKKKDVAYRSVLDEMILLNLESGFNIKNLF